MRVLVTGATGYIGGRVVPVLLARGHEVRCAARTPAKLDGRVWRDEVEVVPADVFDRDSLEAACADMDAVLYLVHSMDGQDDFARRDAQAAANLRDAAAAAGVGRIVYLGGLGDDDGRLSEHLRSRHEVGRVLAEGPVPVTELRAAVIIGSGSASFEMLRHLVEVLPVMVTPKWVSTRCQPVAVRDVLHDLAAVLEVPAAAGRVLEVGGPDVLTYEQLMHAYAEVAGLRRRRIVRVPLLTPRLSSLWIGLVTPLPPGLARPLIDSLENEVVVDAEASVDTVLDREPISCRDALGLALSRVQDLEVATTWASAGGAVTSARAAATGAAAAGELPEDPQAGDPDWAGGTVFSDVRVASSAAPPSALFAAVCSIGGQRGYRSTRWLWAVRGALDKLVGGIGLRRGRRHPQELAVGEVVDFWRVEAYEPPSLLRLRAEMKLPGTAWLEFRVEADGDGSRLVQRARFHPKGLWGRLYWLVVAPFHGLIFPRMVRTLAADAERLSGIGEA
ncbi:MAG: SDR family oxidoreductase [Nitriliruptoraceae bacterium]